LTTGPRVGSNHDTRRAARHAGAAAEALAMEFQADRVDNVLVLTPKVEYLDASNSKEFRERAEDLVGPGTKLVVDLAPVQFVDSSGCGALLNLLKTLGKTGGELKLCNISAPVRALFDLVRMNKIFDIRKSRDDALQAFGAKPG
jgi:anti-sigma B factor antagonist